MIKIKRFNDTRNEQYTESILHSSTAKTHTWNYKGKEQTIKYSLTRDVFSGKFVVELLGGEFDNVYGQGETEDEALRILKIRLHQLRNK